MKRSVLFLSCLILSAPLFSAEPLVITLSLPLSGKDPLTQYNGKVLVLALEKTRKDQGDYLVEVLPFSMNAARSLEEMKINSYTNFVVLTTFQNKLLDDGLDYTRFPVDLGVTGYRVGFVSPSAKIKVAAATSVEDMRAFTIGQGVGWADVAILRSNGFKVVELASYDSPFNMIAAGRIDLFMRGINELETEFVANKSIPGLDCDTAVALSYTLPRFYFSNKGNKKALERLTRGFLAAHRDGTLRKLWLEQYGSSLRFANLKQRKIFQLKTPNLDRIDFDYQKYYFNPRTE